MPKDTYGDIDVNSVESNLDSLNKDQQEKTSVGYNTNTVNNQADSISQDSPDNQDNSIGQVNNSQASPDINPDANPDSQNNLNSQVSSDSQDDFNKEAHTETPQVQGNNFKKQEDSYKTQEEHRLQQNSSLNHDLSGVTSIASSSIPAQDPQSAGSGVNPNYGRTRKNGKYVAMIIAIVAIVGGRLALLHYYNSPEKVAADAVGRLINHSKELRTSGSIRFTSQDKSSRNPIKSLQVDFKTTSNNFDHEFSLDLSIDSSLSKPVNFTLSSVIQKNGVFYVNIDKLSEAFGDTTGLMGLDYTSSSRLIAEFLKNASAEIEGKWWKIDVNDFLASLDKTDFKLEESVKRDITSLHSCVTSGLQEDFGKTDQMTKNYLKYPFLKLSATEDEPLKKNSFNNLPRMMGKIYKVNIDQEKLTNFIKEQDEMFDKGATIKCLKDSSIAKRLTDYSSSSTRSSSLESEKLTSEQKSRLIAEAFSNMYLDISVFTHRLNVVYFGDSDHSREFSGFVTFDYIKNPSIKIPDSAKSVGDAIQHAIEDLKKSQQSTTSRNSLRYLNLDHSSLFDRSNLYRNN